MPETRWTRVESLFHEALQLSADQRDKFLAQACQGDSLLYQEILSLVSHYRSEDELLERMGVPPLAQPAAPAFKAGDCIGLFEIIGLLGKGGMGEVYLARDPRLGRKVALKVLPRSLSGSVIMERLRREAQAASALNHPNILTVYDFGQQDGLQYIVTEFIEGASLRSCIGKLTQAEALNYARQIGEALKAAHAAGIVHRDIKPENIMVRPDGYIKVLDFGLAKLTHLQLESGQSLYQRLSKSDAGSVPGLLVGTVNYMSPEQVRGQTIDERADIWGWGVVLYEMLVGKRPFEAPTPGDTLAAILGKDPVLPTQDKTLDRIVAKALAKDPQDRYQNMDEALYGLTSAKPKSGHFKRSRQGPADLGKSSKLGKLRIASLALLLLAGVLAYWAYHGRANSVSTAAVNVPLHIESIVPLTASGNALQSAISADEQLVAYTTQESDGQQALWIRKMGANAATRRLGAESGKYAGLTFAPNGEFLYYVVKQETTGKLYQLRLPDGLPKMVRDDVASPISFSPDGARYAFLRTQAGKSQIVVAGIELSPENTVWASAAPDYTGDPVWSPDGCCLLFSVLYNSSLQPANIRMVSVNVESRQYAETGRQPWYYVGRPIWFKNSRSILISATRNDSNWARLWEVSWPQGNITPVLPNTFTDLDSGRGQHQIATVEWVRRSQPWVVSLDHPSSARPVPDLQGTFYGVAWTRSGNIISQSDIGGEPGLWNIDPASGKANLVTHDKGVKEYPAVSPDGRYLVYDSNRDGAFQLWRSGLDGSNPMRLTSDTAIEQQAAVTPDGKWVVYTSLRSGIYALWKVAMQGGRPIQLTARAAARAAISPTGAFILCDYDDPQHGWSKAILDAASGKPMRVLPDISASEKAPAIWSADGNSILHVKTQNGVSNIWLRPLHGGPAKQLTHFTDERIFAFALSSDGWSLACIRGTESWNAVLIRIAP